MSKRTRKRAFLEEMDQVMPWSELVGSIEPHYWGKASTGRPPFACEVMLRIHFLQNWFGLSDPAMEESLHDVPLYREFACVDVVAERMPDESTILRFRHLLDSQKRGNQYYFGMKAHIGVDAESGLVHAVVGMAANVHDLTPVEQLHGAETQIHADSGYTGIGKREGLKALDVTWHLAMRSGRRRALPNTGYGDVTRKLEQIKAPVRAKVEHPFRVIKRQFGYLNVRYRGLAKNTANLQTLFALSNLSMVRR